MKDDKQFTYNELECLKEITFHIIKAEDDLAQTLKQILNLLSEKMGLERGIISIYYKEKNEIKHDTFGFDSPSVDVKFVLGEGITGKVVKTGRPIAIPRLDKAPFFLDKTGARKGIDPKELSFICVPINYKNETIGALSIDSKMRNEEEDLNSEINFLSNISDLIAETINRKKVYEENKNLKDILRSSNPLGTLVGNSQPMKELAYQLTLVAGSNVSVLITGETGTGKEVIAREIHKLSNRKETPFVTVNCGAIPEGLIESELFGHKKGAFTGAVKDRVGKFEAASGGTIFLDEIGELPLMLQVKLLRVLQEKEITPVGSNSNIPVDVRVIAATNRNLEIEISNNSFRSDLYYRLNVFQLYLPPLRERGSDIILLADYFIKKYSAALDKRIERIGTSAIDMLMSYHWPGNVRELENCIERACLLCPNDVITSHHLPPSLQVKSVEQRGKKKGKFESLVRAYEIELITDALKDSGGNQTKAARLLDTTKRVIQYKISQYGIDYKRFAISK